MIRFIDITDEDTGPACAFFDTVRDRFIESSVGCHDFTDLDDFDGLEQRERMLGLVPKGFFDPEREKPIEIIVPDDAWVNWPLENRGLYFMGQPGEQEPVLIEVNRLNSDEIEYWDGYGQCTVHRSQGNRFARVTLPVVPKLPS